MTLPGFILASDVANREHSNSGDNNVTITSQRGGGAFACTWTSSAFALVCKAHRPLLANRRVSLSLAESFIYPQTSLNRNSPLVKMSLTTRFRSSGGLPQQVASVPYYSGGCIYGNTLNTEHYDDSIVQLKHVSFFNCSASNYGGGMYISNMETVSIQDSTFRSNTAGIDGGAIGYQVGLSQPLTFTLRNSAISGSSTGRFGGGVSLINSSPVSFDGDMGLATVNIKQSVFKSNVAENSGGAIWANRLLLVTIETSTFESNHAARNGGAVDVSSADGTISSITISDTLFEKNVANERGGGLATQLMKIRLDKSIVRSNTAIVGGGGLYSFSSALRVGDGTSFLSNNGGTEQGSGGGAMRVESCVSPGVRLYGTNFSFNYGTNQAEGGAIKSDSCAMLLSECELHFNRAGFGGALALSSSSSVTTISSTVMMRNAAIVYASTGGDGGALYCSKCGTLQVQDEDGKSTTLITQNNAGRDGGGFWIESAQVELENIALTLNRADRGGGGAVFWSPSNFDHRSYVPTVSMSNEHWENHEPTGTPVYTQNDAHFGSDIATISRNVALEIGNAVDLASPLRVGGLVPGNLSTFSTDFYGQIVTRSANQMKVTVEKPLCDATGACVGQADPTIKGMLVYNTDDETGKVGISGTKMFGQPGATHPLRFYVSDTIGRRSPVHNVTVERCRSGEITAESMLACQDCQPGRFSEYAGYGARRIKPLLNHISCAGTNGGTNPQEDSDCEMCPGCTAGMYQDESGKSDCKACVVGRKSAFANPICAICPTGKFSNPTMTECLSCVPGKFQDELGMGDCKFCIVGKKSATADSLCTPCRPGYFSDSTNTACPPCSGGATTMVGQGSCDTCLGGKYRSNSHATPGNGFRAPCTTCPEGWTNSEGSTFCITCGKGTFLLVLRDEGTDEFVSSTCEQCNAGMYRAESHTIAGPDFKSICTTCPEGWSTAIDGLAAGAAGCVVCPPGTFSKEGSAVCERCPIGTFSSLKKSAVCQKCSEVRAGTAPNDASTACIDIPTCTNVLVHWEDPRVGNDGEMEAGRLTVEWDIPPEWKLAAGSSSSSSSGSNNIRRSLQSPTDNDAINSSQVAVLDPPSTKAWVVLNPQDRTTWSAPRSLPIMDFVGYKIRWAESDGNFNEMEVCTYNEAGDVLSSDCVFEELIEVDPYSDYRTHFNHSIMTRKPLYFATYYIRLQTVVGTTGKDSTSGRPGTGGGWIVASDCGKSKYLNGTLFDSNSNGTHLAKQSHLALSHELQVAARHRDLLDLADTDSEATTVLSLKFEAGDQSITPEEYWQYRCMLIIREELGAKEEDVRSAFLRTGEPTGCSALVRETIDMEFATLDLNRNGVLGKLFTRHEDRGPQNF
jgi:hypothetical protein